VPVCVTLSEATAGGTRIFTAIARDRTEYRQTAERLQKANSLLEEKVVELQERTRVVTLLGKMSDRLQAATNVSEAAAIIADFGGQLLPEDRGAFCTTPASTISSA